MKYKVFNFIEKYGSFGQSDASVNKFRQGLAAVELSKLERLRIVMILSVIAEG